MRFKHFKSCSFCIVQMSRMMISLHKTETFHVSSLELVRRGVQSGASTPPWGQDAFPPVSDTLIFLKNCQCVKNFHKFTFSRKIYRTGRPCAQWKVHLCRLSENYQSLVLGSVKMCSNYFWCCIVWDESYSRRGAIQMCEYEYFERLWLVKKCTWRYINLQKQQNAIKIKYNGYLR